MNGSMIRSDGRTYEIKLDNPTSTHTDVDYKLITISKSLNEKAEFSVLHERILLLKHANSDTGVSTTYLFMLSNLEHAAYRIDNQDRVIRLVFNNSAITIVYQDLPNSKVVKEEFQKHIEVIKLFWEFFVAMFDDAE